MKNTAALAAAALAGSASAHIALFHPSMYGFDNPTAPHPLQQMNFDQWWFHGFMNEPPAPNTFMELPAGGTFSGEVACNKQLTSYGNAYVPGNPMACNEPGEGNTGGALHSLDQYGIPADQTKEVKGCGLAIAYKSDPRDIQPEDFAVISTNFKCPWRRNVDFQIPAGLPACPPGGCHCMWGWVHAPNAGTEQIYSIVYRCQVTGQTGNQPLPAATPARKCPTDKRNCTIGPKQPHYWLQNERNNNFQHWTDPPYYNDEYGFTDGAQTDLWKVPGSGPLGLTQVAPRDAEAAAEPARRVPPQARRDAGLA